MLSAIGVQGNGGSSMGWFSDFLVDERKKLSLPSLIVGNGKRFPQ
jgi:hypothetical protein